MKQQELKEIRQEYIRFGEKLKAAEERAAEVDKEERDRLDKADPVKDPYMFGRKQRGEYYASGATGTREMGDLKRAAMDLKRFLTKKLSP